MVAEDGKKISSMFIHFSKKKDQKMDAKVGLEEDGGKQQHKFESAAFMENVNLRTFPTIMICSL